MLKPYNTQTEAAAFYDEWPDGLLYSPCFRILYRHAVQRLVLYGNHKNRS